MHILQFRNEFDGVEVTLSKSVEPRGFVVARVYEDPAIASPDQNTTEHFPTYAEANTRFCALVNEETETVLDNLDPNDF